MRDGLPGVGDDPGRGHGPWAGALATAHPRPLLPAQHAYLLDVPAHWGAGDGR